MEMLECFITPITPSQQRGLRLYEILTALWNDISLQHQHCSAKWNISPTDESSKMAIGWFMQVSSLGNQQMGWMKVIKARKATADTFSIKPHKHNLALTDCDNAPANAMLSCHPLGPNIDHGRICYVHWVRSDGPGALVMLMTWENRIHIST